MRKDHGGPDQKSWICWVDDLFFFFAQYIIYIYIYIYMYFYMYITIYIYSYTYIYIYIFIFIYIYITIYIFVYLYSELKLFCIFSVFFFTCPLATAILPRRFCLLRQRGGWCADHRSLPALPHRLGPMVPPMGTSGKHTKNYEKSPCSKVKQLFVWPFSIAMLVYQRVWNFWVFTIEHY